MTEPKKPTRRTRAKTKPAAPANPEMPETETTTKSSEASVGDVLGSLGSVGAGGVHSESELAGLLASDDTAGAESGPGGDGGAVDAGQYHHQEGDETPVWIGAKWCSIGARAGAALLAKKFGEICILEKEEADELGQAFDAWAARRFPSIPIGDMEPDTMALIGALGAIVAARVDVEAIISVVVKGNDPFQEDEKETDPDEGGTVTALRFVPVQSDPE